MQAKTNPSSGVFIADITPPRKEAYTAQPTQQVVFNRHGHEMSMRVARKLTAPAPALQTWPSRSSRTKVPVIVPSYVPRPTMSLSASGGSAGSLSLAPAFFSLDFLPYKYTSANGLKLNWRGLLPNRRFIASASGLAVLLLIATSAARFAPYTPISGGDGSGSNGGSVPQVMAANDERTQGEAQLMGWPDASKQMTNLQTSTAGNSRSATPWTSIVSVASPVGSSGSSATPATDSTGSTGGTTTTTPSEPVTTPPTTPVIETPITEPPVIDPTPVPEVPVTPTPETPPTTTGVVETVVETLPTVNVSL